MTPTVGLEVTYKNFVGYVRSVDDSCATICISKNKDRSRDVCLVVYREDFKHIRLLKESDK